MTGSPAAPQGLPIVFSGKISLKKKKLIAGSANYEGPATKESFNGHTQLRYRHLATKEIQASLTAIKAREPGGAYRGFVASSCKRVSAPAVAVQAAITELSPLCWIMTLAFMTAR